MLMILKSILLCFRNFFSFFRSLQVFQTIQRTFGAHAYLIKLSSVEKVLKEPQYMQILEQKSFWNMPFNIPEDTQYLFRDYINFSNQYHGLSNEDMSSIRAFVKELISRSILPVMKCSVDIWNEQVNS